MTHTAPTVATMSVSHRRGGGKPSLGGGQSHGDTSHLNHFGISSWEITIKTAVRCKFIN